MKPAGAVLVCCLLVAFDSLGVYAYTDCDGLVCLENQSCSISSTMVDGKQRTERTCTDMQGNVLARRVTIQEGGNPHHSNIVQSSNIMMSSGGSNCVQYTSYVNGITTNRYQCNTDDGNSYYITNTNGDYKNCTSVPVTSDDGVTTMQERCVPMSAEDIQKVQQMEQEAQRRAAEVQQRLTGMANDMQARTHEMQSGIMDTMNNMRQNMQHTFGSMFNRF